MKTADVSYCRTRAGGVSVIAYNLLTIRMVVAYLVAGKERTVFRYDDMIGNGFRHMQVGLRNRLCRYLAHQLFVRPPQLFAAAAIAAAAVAAIAAAAAACCGNHRFHHLEGRCEVRQTDKIGGVALLEQSDRQMIMAYRVHAGGLQDIHPLVTIGQCASDEAVDMSL